MDIDITVMEQQINEYEIIHNIMNKLDLYIEADLTDTEAFDNLIAEMYDVYLEATARRKQQQEIAKYMQDNKLGDVKGNNPSKRRKARKVQNTLLQHDFDPKTQTIRSDVTNPNSSSKRVALKVRKADIDEDDDELLDTGPGPVYVPGDTDSAISMPLSYLKKEKQGSAGFYTHHELGHHKSEHEGTSSMFARTPKNTQRTSPNDPGMRHIIDTKKSGKYVNNHDDGSYLRSDGKENPEELYADLHGARAARVRTKHWGNKSSGKKYKEKLNKGTRSLTDKEILNIFKRMSEDAKRINKEFVSTEMNWLKRQLFVLKKAQTGQKLTNDDIRELSDIICPDDLMKTADDKEKLESHIETSEMFIRICENELVELNEAMRKNNLSAEQIKETQNSINDCIETIKRYKADLIKEQSDLQDFINKHGKYYFTDLKKMDQLSEVDRDAVSKKFLPIILKEVPAKLKEVMKQMEDVRRIVTTGSKLMETSTKMRYDFVMKYKDDKTVQEYFTELFNEYYNLKNLESGDLIGE